MVPFTEIQKSNMKSFKADLTFFGIYVKEAVYVIHTCQYRPLSNTENSYCKKCTTFIQCILTEMCVLMSKFSFLSDFI